MKTFVLIGAVCLQLAWSQARDGYSSGVGAFSYQDSSGKRYGGTYGLKDGEVVDAKGTFPPDFSPHTDFSPPIFNHNDFTGFFPEYLRNLENLLQDAGFAYHPTPQIPQYIPKTPYSYKSIPDYGAVYNHIPNYGGSVPSYVPNDSYDNNNINRAFQANLDNQKIALDAARKAFDLTSNQAGNLHNLNPPRSGFEYSGFADAAFPPGFPFEEPFPMPNFGKGGGNGAYARAAVGPGYHEQVAAISPANPNSPNIFKKSSGSGNPGGYKSVSVSSFSSSSDINGRKTNSQGADTLIDDNGKQSSYHVRSS